LENVPITPIEKGGPEHRFGAQVAGAEPSGAPERLAAAHPLERPVETWSEQDVRAVLSSPAYLEPQHPRREQAQRLIRAWFERRFGTGPARVDATGRRVREDHARSGDCPVPVRAHTRGGGKVEVGAHCRTRHAV
jgi:hypothetical protein